MGTSLQVEPFNRLITRVPSSCPRILINRDRAGEFPYSGFDFDDQWNGKYRRDALYLGSCDEGVRKLVQLCGWEVNESYTVTPLPSPAVSCSCLFPHLRSMGTHHSFSFGVGTSFPVLPFTPFSRMIFRNCMMQVTRNLHWPKS